MVAGAAEGGVLLASLCGPPNCAGIVSRPEISRRSVERGEVEVMDLEGEAGGGASALGKEESEEKSTGVESEGERGAGELI